MPSAADILVPLFSCIALGIAVGAARLFNGDHTRALSRFVFLVAMPIAVFDFMRDAEPPGAAYAGLIVGYLLAMAGTVALALILCRRALDLGIRDAGAGVFATVCGNAVYLGLPIALAVGSWGPPFLILMLFEGLFVFAIGTALMTWPEAGATPPRGGVAGAAVQAGWRAGRNPIVLAAIGGLAIALTEGRFPGPISAFLDLFGAVAGPTGLFVLGLFVVILPQEGARPDAKALALLLPLKLVLFPALAAALVWLLTRDPLFVATVALFCGMPPAVASIIQSAHYRAWEVGTATLVTAGTLIGLGTVSALLVVLLQI